MLKNSEFIRDLIKAERSAKLAQDLSGRSLGSLKGKVVDVNDPENRGRIKVLFDNMSPMVREQPDSEQYTSHWIEASPSIVGKQSKLLIGSRVVIQPTDGNMGQSVIQDIIYDPETESVNAEEMPKSSTATRLPIYNSGELPPACPENRGLTVVEADGPMGSDWLCTCLKRRGTFIWVRHCDLAHGHAGQNDGDQGSDSDGDGEAPVNELAVWDYVFPTSDQEMDKSSSFGLEPRSNPSGSEAIWYDSPGGGGD